MRAFSLRFSSIISKRGGGTRDKKGALTKREEIKQEDFETSTKPKIIKLFSVSTYFAI
jgi:hypothetical protein